MISRIPGKAFVFVALALSIPAAWLLGNEQAEELSREQLQQVQIGAEQQQLRLQALIDTLESEIQQQDLTLEIVEARAASLQEELDASLKQSIDDEAELALYRRIEGVENERGIRVDAISRTRSEPDMLAITLVQARGRDRASGAIGMTLFSSRGGRDQRWILSDGDRGVLTPAVSPESQGGEQPAEELLASALSDDVVKVAQFDLRFFQTLLVKVENITTINPDYVEIGILPEGKRLKPQLQRFRWAEIGFDR